MGSRACMTINDSEYKAGKQIIEHLIRDFQCKFTQFQYENNDHSTVL